MCFTARALSREVPPQIGRSSSLDARKFTVWWKRVLLQCGETAINAGVVIDASFDKVHSCTLWIFRNSSVAQLHQAAINTVYASAQNLSEIY